ncbi:MAG: YeeE/YedE thiosulfate transporter family protein, partial [Oscillospiraceae bacterium]
PIAHSAHLWNLLGMVLVGWGSVLLGGCPLRQLILAGEGNGDSAVTVLGMVMGAALAHNFGLAGNPDSLNEAKELVVGGISTGGKVAIFVGFAVFLVISLMNLPKEEKK